MSECINKELALSFSLANGKYDHKNANEHFIYGIETYKEWLEQLPTVSPINGFDLKTICDFIISHDDECKAIEYLTQALNQKAINRLESYRDARCSLKAIQKINAGKNEAIDALCDENY